MSIRTIIDVTWPFKLLLSTFVCSYESLWLQGYFRLKPCRVEQVMACTNTISFGPQGIAVA